MFDLEELGLSKPLSKESNTALEIGYEFCTRNRQSFMTTPYILYGLSKEEYGLGGKIIREADINPEKLKEEYRDLFTPNENFTDRVEMGPKSKLVLKSAETSSKEEIRTLNLVIGLLTETKGLHNNIFQKEGFNYNTLEKLLRELKL